MAEKHVQVYRKKLHNVIFTAKSRTSKVDLFSVITIAKYEKLCDTHLMKKICLISST